MEFAFAMLMALGVVAWVGAIVCLKGWALAILWGWFAVPIFHLPTLSIPQALGISLVVSTLTHSTSTSEQTDKVKIWIYPVAFPLFSLGVGWIIKGFM